MQGTVTLRVTFLASGGIADGRHDLFGRDVSLVPREQPLPLARAIVGFLLEKRRTSVTTQETLEREFRPTGVAARYRSLYDRVLTGNGA